MKLQPVTSLHKLLISFLSHCPLQDDSMFVVVGAKETVALTNLSFIFHPLFRN